MEYFWIDIIAIGLVVLGGVVGMFRGFFATLLSLLGFLGTFILAYFFSDEILMLFEKLFGVKTWICGLLGESVGGVVAIVASLVLTYIIIRILIFLLNHTIGAIFKGKLLGGVNSFLGFFLGMLKGAAYVAIMLVVLNIASLIPQVKTWADGVMSETYVTGTIYNWIGDQIGDYFSDETAGDTEAETPAP